MRFLSITIVGLAAACSSTTPYGGGAVDVTVTSDAAVASNIVLLGVQMSGAETLDVTTPPPAGFGSSGRADITLRATGTSGTVTVTVTGRNLAGDLVARGQTDATLKAGTTKVNIALTAVGPATDMAVPMDLATADLAPYPPIVPSNVSPTRYLPNAPALSGLLEIDTTNLTFTRASGVTNDGGVVESVDAGAVMPAGIEFVVDGNYAVLSTGALTIDRELWIRGSRPLVIVASGPVVIRNLVHAEARGTTPGPGGSAGATGMGAGASGVITLSGVGTGGGGGGFGGAGAAGGGICPSSSTSMICPAGTTPAPGSGPGPTGGGGGGLGGPVFAATVLVGGSGGGHGGNQSNCGPGGGGGGAIQISTSQTIDVLAPGAINVGGGGGAAPAFLSCSGGGGGGGSGGMILLEARGITVAGGQLSATGGGGGIFQNPGGDGTLLLGGQGTFNWPFPQVVAGSGGTPAKPASAGVETTTAYPQGAPGGGGGWGVVRFRLPPNTDPTISSPGIVVPDAQIDHTL